MSNYDLLAISHKPEFYLSSNSSGDQSGTGLYGLTNGAANMGQPIIVGNPSSWRVSSTESIALDANPIFFREGVELEFVIQKLQPLDTVCIFGDTDGYNGIFLMPEGIQVRFVDADLNQKSATIGFSIWPEKMHIILTFDSVYCTLRANDQTAQVAYRETDPDSIASVSFKTTSGNTYYIDGVGVYSDAFESKRAYVDALDFDYSNFINRTYSATGTLFDGYRGLPKVEIRSTQFTPDPIEVESYLFTMNFPMSSDEDFSSISIESNFSDMQMKYKTNDGSWTSFTGNTSFTPTTNFFLLQIRVKVEDAQRPFIIKVFPMFDDRITTNTPAELVPNGGPLYPDKHTSSIVNFPEGVELYEISYEGEWIDYIPNSIEIVFMPKATTKTIVFENADGSVSCGTGGSISGFTAYLNGAVVTDLNNVRINQWNHLILTDASPTAQTFYLNSTTLGADENIVEYAFLASYPSVLSAGTVSQLYSIISSYHKATVTENPADITEGALDGSSPFKIYTHAWAIIGGGGI